METIDAIAIAIQINRMAPFIIDNLDIQKIHGLLDPIHTPSSNDPQQTRLFSTPQLKTLQRIAFAKSSD
ncbi:hypothetical protein [Burkholderia diffusa]|uniref:hypothetical protein n=1 Tax=Burkholderia diffusa TaxID=488732 RepID=UPI0012D8560B|nr:hypothetical protein [Burkholderia diffusa]